MTFDRVGGGLHTGDVGDVGHSTLGSESKKLQKPLHLHVQEIFEPLGLRGVAENGS